MFGFPGQTQEGIKSTQDLIVQRMREIPGVDQVGYTGSFPIFANFPTSTFPIRGFSPQQVTDALPMAISVFSPRRSVSARWGHLVRWRDAFLPADVLPQARRVFIVDQNFAKKNFPGRSAVGEAFLVGGPKYETRGSARQIVGVVAHRQN